MHILIFGLCALKRSWISPTKNSHHKSWMYPNVCDDEQLKQSIGQNLHCLKISAKLTRLFDYLVVSVLWNE